MDGMYHEGSRALQERFGSTALADRLLKVTHRTAFTDEDRAFVESVSFFFLATADPQGRPDCSFKGGPAGFVRVVASDTIVFPDYDGNGMFKSLGNIAANPNVGMLFIRMTDAPKRFRVNGTARIELDPVAVSQVEGAQALIFVTARNIFPNCPRYVPDQASGTPSKYVPKQGEPRVEPAWKSFDVFKDVVPERKA